MSEKSAAAFMEWTAGIRKMLIEAGEKSAAARVDSYSFETFDAGWQASRRAVTAESIEATSALIANGLLGAAPEEDVREVERLINEMLGRT